MKWHEGAAIEAAAEGFKAWRSLRGRGNDERWKILEAVSDFIDRHGDSRFSSVDREERYDREGQSLEPDPRIGAEAIVRDRAGWWQDDGDERVYLFNAEGLRDALTGFDFKRALDTLQEVAPYHRRMPAASGQPHTASAGGRSASTQSAPTSWRPIMGLESLLTRLKGRSVTPVTPGHTGGVTETPITKQACYPVTPVTPKKVQGDPLMGRLAEADPPAGALPPERR